MITWERLEAELLGNMGSFPWWSWNRKTALFSTGSCQGRWGPPPEHEKAPCAGWGSMTNDTR